jgi:hypothetical protein
MQSLNWRDAKRRYFQKALTVTGAAPAVPSLHIHFIKKTKKQKIEYSNISFECVYIIIQQNEDDEFLDKKNRFTKMARDFNEMGAGMYECLGDTKGSFQTSSDLALVIDKVRDLLCFGFMLKLYRVCISNKVYSIAVQ